MGGQTFEFNKKIENSERRDSHQNSNAAELRSSIQKESSGKKNNHC